MSKFTRRCQSLTEMSKSYPHESMSHRDVKSLTEMLKVSPGRCQSLTEMFKVSPECQSFAPRDVKSYPRYQKSHPRCQSLYPRYQNSHHREPSPQRCCQPKQGYEGTVSSSREVVDLLLEYACTASMTASNKEHAEYASRTGNHTALLQPDSLDRGLGDVSLMAGEWLTERHRTCQHVVWEWRQFTYEIAPVFVLMEGEDAKRALDGMGERRTGILAPGGSICQPGNARMVHGYNRFPEVMMRACAPCRSWRMFTSKDAHYSSRPRSLAWAMDSVYLVDTDKHGQQVVEAVFVRLVVARMLPRAPLEQLIRTRPQPAVQGALLRSAANPAPAQPCWGAFDPLTAIADVCERRTGSGSTWTRPGAAARSAQSQRHRRTPAVPGCSVPTRSALESHKADGTARLMPPARRGTSACCKAATACRRTNLSPSRTSSITTYLCQQLKKRPGYEMVMEKPRLCQRLLLVRAGEVPLDEAGTGEGQRHQRGGPQSEGADDGEWHHNGGLQPLGNLPNFFRMIVSNPAATEADIDFLLDCIEKYSAEIFDDQPDEAGLGGGGGAGPVKAAEPGNMTNWH
uniref:DUF2263 domain-containing protein n=1 Tax=Macrostomum lignano TaxID=282301 RepID=A0A1I8FPE3_9PLAT